jgi:hypothetical protein
MSKLRDTTLKAIQLGQKGGCFSYNCEKIDVLFYQQLIKTSNEILISTQVGHGNTIIVHPSVALSMLELALFYKASNNSCYGRICRFDVHEGYRFAENYAVVLYKPPPGTLIYNFDTNPAYYRFIAVNNLEIHDESNFNSIFNGIKSSRKLEKIPS